MAASANHCLRSHGKGTDTPLDRLVQAGIISCSVRVLGNLDVVLLDVLQVVWLVELNKRGYDCWIQVEA